MRSLNIVLFILLISIVDTAAQHCPFDGGNMIVVKVTDRAGNAVTDIKEGLFAVEADDKTDAGDIEGQACPPGKTSLQKPIEPVRDMLLTRYKSYWEHWIKPKYEDWQALQPGYYAVVIRTDELYCKLEENGKTRQLEKNFEIGYRTAANEQKMPVPAENIYPMCTDAGSWKRMQPVEFVLDQVG